MRPQDWEDVVKHLALFCAAFIAVVGCGDDEETAPGNGTCISSSDCPTGQFCVNSLCTPIDSGEVGFNDKDGNTGTPDVVDVTNTPDPGSAPI